MRPPPRVVVLGVGNLIMGDEGVGVRCVEALSASSALPPHVRLIDGGTSTHELLEELENLDQLIILDAVEAPEAPGTIVYLEGAQIPSSLTNRLSPHQHGINDLLANLQLLGRAPARVQLLGVVPAHIELSLSLSPTVEEVVPKVCARVLTLLCP